VLNLPLNCPQPLPVVIGVGENAVEVPKGFVHLGGIQLVVWILEA